MKIPLNIPYFAGNESTFIEQTFESGFYAGDGPMGRKCEDLLSSITGCPHVLMTSSCTHALEMAAILLEVSPGDEIIMSSFNFVSAANAFVLRGARIIFVDIDPQTMNIDADKIKDALTNNTKAIVVMHYGGVACDLEKIGALANEYSIPIIEDAAHCIDAYERGTHLGTIGDLGTLSFHASKNVHCGEGGALLINNPRFLERAITIREKGTNKKAFYAGQVDKYSWVDLGSSYLMSEISAAFLFAQLQTLKEVTAKRKSIWSTYADGLEGVRTISTGHEHNAHIFYLICKDKEERQRLRLLLKERSITTAHHYIPLHSSQAGKKYGFFHGVDRYATDLSERLLRLPIYYSLENPSQIVEIISKYLV